MGVSNSACQLTLTTETSVPLTKRDCPGFCWLGVLGRYKSGSVDCFMFDGREYSQPSVLSPAVVNPVDAAHDGQPDFLPGTPSLTAEDVLLPQRANDSIAAWAAHGLIRPIEPVSRWCRSDSTKRRDRNWEPRSGFTTVPSGRRALTAFSGAATINEEFIRESIEGPTVLAE